MRLLFISHSLGGGIALHINNKAHLYAKSIQFNLIIPRNGKLELSEYDQKKQDFVFAEHVVSPSRLMELLRNEENVELHSLVGWPSWAISALALCERENLTFYFHDYSLFRENEHLLINENGLWNGNLNPISNPEISIILGNSVKVVAPSFDCARRISEILKIKVEKVLFEDLCTHNVKRTEIDIKIEGRKVVLVPGHMSKQKGSEVFRRVLEISQLVAPDILYFVAGSDHTLSISGENVCFLGGYSQGELISIANDLKIEACWWPTNGSETFSYTFSEMLSSGYRLIVPKRGSFTERASGLDLAEFVDNPDSPISHLNAITSHGSKVSTMPEFRFEEIFEYRFGEHFGLVRNCAKE